MEVVDRGNVKYSDIKKFMGVAATLQSQYLNKYEPKAPAFPGFQENLAFVSVWNCMSVQTGGSKGPIGHY